MCGIAGFVDKEIFNPQQMLDKMLEKQKHRGPDFCGKWCYEKEGLFFGHNRLSIIDLSTAANQPMVHVSGKYVIIFNGEIYNYIELKKQYLSHIHFQTGSDTEVLLNLIIENGLGILDELVGMFAFAFYDIVKNELILVRDRFGVKPLYYYHLNNKFYFASEIKTLKAAGINTLPNNSVWADYLVNGSYGYPNETFWTNISQLPGGHYLIYNNNGLKINQWYDFVANVNGQPIFSKDSDLIEYYEQLLETSIRYRFRADVPIGFNISGGLDSSILIAFIKKLFPKNKEIKAFTFYSGDERYDELPWVQEMIHQTQYPLLKVKLNSGELPELAQKVSQMQDEPYGGVPTIAYSKIFCAAREHGVIVLLDGQGMDEAWAGYDYYWKNSNSLVQGTTSSPVSPEVLDENFRSLARKNSYPGPFEEPLKSKQYRDIFYTKIPRALRFNDRVSMMHSTELREPFLDNRLLELAFAQDEKMKGDVNITKRILRLIATKYLGDNIAFAPKRPVQTPQREWLSVDQKDWTIDMLNKLSKIAWFDGGKMKEKADLFYKGKFDNSFFIWQWIECSLLLNENQ